MLLFFLFIISLLLAFSSDIVEGLLERGSFGFNVVGGPWASLKF